MTVPEVEIARSQGARGAYRWFEPRGPSYVVLALAVANLISFVKESIH